MTAARTFPILLIPANAGEQASIPWDFIKPHAHQAWLNHGQTLEQLAEGGGLSWYQILCVVAGTSEYPLSPDQAQIEVEARVQEWQGNQTLELFA